MAAALHLDRIAWALHRRYEHKCGHTMTSTDEAFLSQLSLKIRERFLLIFSGSIGAYESLTQFLLSISTKSMLFGTFCNGANEVFRVKH